MRKSVIAIIIIVLVVLYMSVFVVKEGERGITLRFGKVLRDDDNKPLVYEPGLHFKIPFIETVKMLDARIQTMDNQADRFVTKEKKDLIVDSYIKWRISDFSGRISAIIEEKTTVIVPAVRLSMTLGKLAAYRTNA